MRMSSQDVTVVALLADPDAPTEIARHIARTLPDRLADRWGKGRRFDVEVISEPFTAGTEDPSALVRRIAERVEEEDWDVVVALTDLPLHTHGRKLVVDVSHEHALALLSLPALGGLRLQSRARRVVEEAVLSLASPRPDEAGEPSADWSAPERIASRFAPVHADPAGEQDSAGWRYVVSGPRGYLRVLTGMVRANRPWRLVPGLSKALAAALATGAIATVNSTIWTLSVSLSTPRLVIAMVGSLALMIGWLIVDAHLWHRTDKALPQAKKRAVLYNASTVLTVAIGVIICYVGLLAVNLVWALFILNGQAFSSLTRSPLHAAEYWTLAWFVASVATAGGALGSGLESDEAIRAAAYSKREQERRNTLHDNHDDRDEQDDQGDQGDRNDRNDRGD
ncbi:hypothetical protein [Streptomyces sp. MMBL 11-3]|uniref:hypothetical protein n=1 Tax=Streptomyces sp. MMBL 11-3 TaxID=3382639 RepID=UPI0039B38829